MGSGPNTPPRGLQGSARPPSRSSALRSGRCQRPGSGDPASLARGCAPARGQPGACTPEAEGFRKKGAGLLGPASGLPGRPARSGERGRAEALATPPLLGHAPSPPALRGPRGHLGDVVSTLRLPFLRGRCRPSPDCDSQKPPRPGRKPRPPAAGARIPAARGASEFKGGSETRAVPAHLAGPVLSSVPGTGRGG